MDGCVATIAGWWQWMAMVVQGLRVVGPYGGWTTGFDTMQNWITQLRVEVMRYLPFYINNQK